MTTHIDETTVGFDLYKDIHKAIRAELFGATLRAGEIDPGDDDGRAELAERISAMVRLLVSHAEHEDEHVQGLVVRHVPRLGERIERDHVELDRRMLDLTGLAAAAADAGAARARGRLHELYLAMAGFAGDYLAHQDLEERLVMPALRDAVPLPELVGVHERIVASIPPSEMAASLSLMLPAMNVDDRTDLLAGMQAGAPPEVFVGVVGLARTVLTADDFTAVSTRMGITEAMA